MDKRGSKKGQTAKSPYAGRVVEALPLWYQDLIYEASTYNSSIRQIATILKKNPQVIWRALKLRNVQDAIAAEKKKLRADREKQLAQIDKTAIHRVEHLLKTSREPGLVANLAVKHLKGRGIYIDN